MKTLSKIILLTIILLLLFGCEKTDSLSIESEKPIQVEFVPAEQLLEKRTGQNELVYFDATGIFADALNQDSVVSIINLRNIDSIRYVTNWSSPTINVNPNNTHCWKYEITFWKNGVSYTRTAFAKYRGIQYRQVPYVTDGWDSDVIFIHSIRLSTDSQPYFDHECLRNKITFKHQIREYKLSGEYQIYNQYLRSNVCTRNQVIYPRKFKS